MKSCSDRGDLQLVQLQSVGRIGEKVAAFSCHNRRFMEALVVISADPGEKDVARFVKGAFMSRFDLSCGPIPAAKYPADFVSEEQSNTIALMSTLQLNAAKEGIATTILTFDDIETIGIGTLGRVSTIGFYSLIVFLSISAPRRLSENVDKILKLLVDFNTRLKNTNVAQDSLVKELFTESCKILEPSREESRAAEEIDSPRLDDSIMKIVSLVTPLISDYQNVIETSGIPLIESIVELMGNLLLLAASFCSLHSCSSLCDLLFKI